MIEVFGFWPTVIFTIGLVPAWIIVWKRTAADWSLLPALLITLVYANETGNIPVSITVNYLLIYFSGNIGRARPQEPH